MVRTFKFHEQKLLKKVDFINWKSEKRGHELQVIRKYVITNREDYVKYNRLVGKIEKLLAMLKHLPDDDEQAKKVQEELSNKLYEMGIIPEKGLKQLTTLKTSAFCRRRLPVVMFKMKMAPSVRDAVKFIEQGHIRVGPEVVVDPAFLVNKTLEDYVTWVDSSKIKRTVLKYRGEVDDFDLL